MREETFMINQVLPSIIHISDQFHHNLRLRKTKVGHVIFQDSITKQEISLFLNQENYFQLKQSLWRNSQYKAIRKLSNSISEITIEKLELLNYKKGHKLLSQIWDINFSQLKQLRISSSRIYSIQGIQLLKIPHLTKIALIKNNIVNINCLIKVDAKNLQAFQINDNATLQIQDLYKGSFVKVLKNLAKTEKKNLKKFANKPQYQKVQKHQLSIFWLVKFLRQ